MSRWSKEARDLPPDPITGAAITRLSGSSIRTENIYCDDPRATADGRRFASLRYIDEFLSPTKALLCHDLVTKHTHLIDLEVTGHPVGPPWGGSIYYPSGPVLKRADLNDCTSKTVLELDQFPPLWQLMSVSFDERYLLYTALVQNKPEAYNLVRVDLPTGNWQYLLTAPVQDRLGGLFQPFHNDCMIVARAIWEGDTRYGVGMVCNGLGQNARQLYSRAHHATWLSGSGKAAALLSFDHTHLRHLPERPDGELMIYDLAGAAPKFIAHREHLFYHISSSRCGRYVVCEGLENALTAGPTPLVIVNVETGRYQTLVHDSGSPGGGGGDSGRQTKPYFTADSKHIIYTAEPDGVVNVYAAAIPDGFLAKLD